MGENELIKQTENNFENIKHMDENNIEFWYARELMTTLGYKAWRYFEDVIKKSIIACENSNITVVEHFVVNNKTSPMPNGGSKTIADYKLTRYACYLIAQNANPRLKPVALAQTYFAVQTRKQDSRKKSTLWGSKIKTPPFSANVNGRMKKLTLLFLKSSSSVASCLTTKISNSIYLLNQDLLKDVSVKQKKWVM